MPLAVGSKAPDFTLKTKTAEGLKDIKLSDNFGKKQTVLLFYPLAFTGTCTTEMCDISQGIGAYGELGADQQRLERGEDGAWMGTTAGPMGSVQRLPIAYTILGSCRLAGVDPREYLADVLPQLTAKFTAS